MQRVLNSRTFVACLLAMATGLVVYFRLPFPAENVFLRVMSVRAPLVYQGTLYSYNLFLFTTPYIAYSMLLSLVYISGPQFRRRLRPMKLPVYPEPEKRHELCLVVGEVHNPKKRLPSLDPYWLTIPERGLFTGVAILGAIGSGKTSCCMYPFADQILAYQAHDPEKRIGGLVLEVKGDFCHKVREILERHNRAEDYIEINLNSEYRYNPLHNNLDAYALAYNIASLLNNLFGRGKEPFWQQAYTNLVKFIILLHKVAYDYVTLFDVYECAISPVVLERKINEAERRLGELDSVLVSEETYPDHARILAPFDFRRDTDVRKFRTRSSPGLLAVLRDTSIPHEILNETLRNGLSSEKRQQLDAVERWFYNDWQRIEPKLRTSIVEGIAVFLSLFDDNPAVKRTFCPPPECYDPIANADFKFGRPLPSFSWLVENGKVCALNFPVVMNAGLARALGVMMKLDFQRAVLSRIPEIEAHPDRYFRQVLFMCDEYQYFATVGESEPTGDEKFLSLSRQPKCIPIVATQSISSLKSSLPGETWRTLLQAFRSKIFLALSDDFSAKTAAELCGREERFRVTYNLSESGHDAGVSILSARTVSHRANLGASKGYSLHNDFRFDPRIFMELQNAQSVAMAYDGLNPLSPRFCYLKPYYNDPNESYFVQLAKGKL